MDLICFDLDNTLINADKAHYVAFNRAFKKNNLKKIKKEKIVKLFGMEKKKIIKTLFPSISNKKLKKVMDDHRGFFLSDTKKYLKNIRGVKKALKKLKKRYKLGIVSNSSHITILSSLRVTKFDIKLFDVIIGRDDVEHGKPSAEEIFKAQKLSHVKAKYIVGDSIYDIIAGKKAKIKTIGVLTGHYSERLLIKYKADIIIKSVSEINRYV